MHFPANGQPQNSSGDTTDPVGLVLTGPLFGHKGDTCPMIAHSLALFALITFYNAIAFLSPTVGGC